MKKIVLFILLAISFGSCCDCDDEDIDIVYFEFENALLKDSILILRTEKGNLENIMDTSYSTEDRFSIFAGFQNDWLIKCDSPYVTYEITDFDITYVTSGKPCKCRTSANIEYKFNGETRLTGDRSVQIIEN